MIIILPFGTNIVQEFRPWLEENVGKCYKFIEGVGAYGYGWGYSYVEDEKNSFLLNWKITIDDEHLATLFKLRFL